MEQNYPAYRAIRMDTWPRREHFAYYRRQIRCGYSLTVRNWRHLQKHNTCISFRVFCMLPREPSIRWMR